MCSGRPTAAAETPARHPPTHQTPLTPPHRRVQPHLRPPRRKTTRHPHRHPRPHLRANAPRTSNKGGQDRMVVLALGVRPAWAFAGRLSGPPRALEGRSLPLATTEWPPCSAVDPRESVVSTCCLTSI